MMLGTLIVNGGNTVSLRSKFLAYVEYQRGAEEAYYVEGPLSSNAKSMFAEANRRKAELLEMMDMLDPFDNAIESVKDELPWTEQIHE